MSRVNRIRVTISYIRNITSMIKIGVIKNSTTMRLLRRNTSITTTTQVTKRNRRKVVRIGTPQFNVMFSRTSDPLRIRGSIVIIVKNRSTLRRGTIMTRLIRFKTSNVNFRQITTTNITTTKNGGSNALNQAKIIRRMEGRSELRINIVMCNLTFVIRRERLRITNQNNSKRVITPRMSRFTISTITMELRLVIDRNNGNVANFRSLLFININRKFKVGTRRSNTYTLNHVPNILDMRNKVITSRLMIMGLNFPLDLPMIKIKFERNISFMENLAIRVPKSLSTRPIRSLNTIFTKVRQLNEKNERAPKTSHGNKHQSARRRPSYRSTYRRNFSTLIFRGGSSLYLGFAILRI